MTVPTEADYDNIRKFGASGLASAQSAVTVFEAFNATIANWHAAPTEPVPPDPPQPTDRYANLVGFASVGFKKNLATAPVLTVASQVLAALETPGSAFTLGGDIRLPRRAMVASGVYCNLHGYKLTSATSTVLEFGDFGRPSTAVTDSAIVNGQVGPVPYAGPQTGDGVRIHAGSTRIWLDGLTFMGPFGDEAVSILHYVPEPKSAMRVTLSNCKWQKMARNPPDANYAVLIGDGSDGAEIGKTPDGVMWAQVPPRQPPIEVTMYRCVMDTVWWRCPLVYSGRLHYVESSVTNWNHPDGGGPACDLYGAAEGLVERCTFDKGASSTKAAAIQCNPKEGFTPRLTERNNTFKGAYPNGQVVRNGAVEAALPLPYTL